MRSCGEEPAYNEGSRLSAAAENTHCEEESMEEALTRIQKDEHRVLQREQGAWKPRELVVLFWGFFL